MSNTVYLTPNVNETLKGLELSEKQVQDLNIAMESLSRDPTGRSRIVLADTTPGGGLRELKQDNIRVFYRIDPATQTVMIADIRSKDSAEAFKTQTENEMAAAS